MKNQRTGKNICGGLVVLTVLTAPCCLSAAENVSAPDKNTGAAPAAVISEDGKTEAQISRYNKTVVYQDRISGDEARKMGDFGTAASFYRAYFEKAVTAGDTAAQGDACGCEIDAWILAGKPEQAEQALKRYEKLFPQEKNTALELWRADIHLLRRNIPDAQKILDSVLETLPEKEYSLRLRAQLSLASAYELTGNYRDAVKLYVEISKSYESLIKPLEPGHNASAASASPVLPDNRDLVNRVILEHMALALIADNDPAATNVLNQLREVTDEQGAAESLQLLTLYLSLKNNTAVYNDIWNELKRMSEKRRSGAFFFLLTSLIGDEFAARKSHQDALDAYRMAFSYARNNADLLDALTHIISMFCNMDDKNAAAELACSQLGLLNSVRAPLLKIRIAHLLLEAGRETQALELFAQIFHDRESGESIRRNTFEAAFHTALNKKSYVTADKLIQMYFGDKDPEAGFYRAEAVAHQGREAEALKMYAAIAEKVYPRAAERAVDLAVKQKDFDAVIDMANILLDRNARHPVLFLRAMAFAVKGENPTARVDYIAFSEIPDASDEQKAMALFRAASLFFKEEKLTEAGQLFERVFAEYPGASIAPAAGYWLVYCTLPRENSGPGQKQILKIAQKHAFELAGRYPDSEFAGKALLRLAEYYVNAKMRVDAERLFDDVQDKKFNPVIQSLFAYKRALMHYSDADYAETEKVLKDIAQRYPEQTAGQADILMLLGDACREQEKFTEAAAFYKKAAEAKKDTVFADAARGAEADCLFALATANNTLEKLKEPLNIYLELLHSGRLVAVPPLEAKTMYAVARTHELLRNTANAEGAYRNLLVRYNKKQLQTDPAVRVWVQKGIDNLETIAIKSPGIETIDFIVKIMSDWSDHNIAGSENYRQRIRRLHNLKQQRITAGEMK